VATNRDDAQPQRSDRGDGRDEGVLTFASEWCALTPAPRILDAGVTEAAALVGADIEAQKASG
jgi:hypothetical protein